MVSNDDSRLVVTDYFLNEDAAGIIRFEGDHKVHVLKVTHDGLTEDTRFKLDFKHGFLKRPCTPPRNRHEVDSFDNTRLNSFGRNGGSFLRFGVFVSAFGIEESLDGHTNNQEP